MKKQRFEDWEYSQINEEFGYKRHYKNFNRLEEWLAAEEPVTAAEKAELLDLSELLLFNTETWNEDELKMFFIAPLLRVINFQSPYYKMFTQRKFSAVIGDWELKGIFDFVVSKGEQRPKEPYFFLHEYKQKRKKENDPLGQLLAAMVVAQYKNEKKMPLYGCYVVGRNYFFVLLYEKEYAVSDALLATNEGYILQIFKMMRYAKVQIDKYVSQ